MMKRPHSIVSANGFEELTSRVADAKTMLEASDAESLEGMVYMLFSGIEGELAAIREVLSDLRGRL
jgi:hypothetical protein